MDGVTETVWVVTRQHADDRKVVLGVFERSDDAYALADEYDFDAGPVESPSVMAHPLLKGSADA